MRCNCLQYLKLFEERFIFWAFFSARRDDRDVIESKDFVTFIAKYYIVYYIVYRYVLYDFNFIISRHLKIYRILRRAFEVEEREQRVFMRVTHLNVLTWARMYGACSDLVFSNLFGRLKSTLQFMRMQMRIAECILNIDRGRGGEPFQMFGRKCSFPYFLDEAH